MGERLPAGFTGDPYLSPGSIRMEILFGKKRLVVGPRDSPGTEGIVVCYSPGMAAFSVSQEKVGDFCRRNHIKRLAFFGSVLRDDFRPDSDLDVIVEFEPGHVPGLRYFAMERELSEILGRKVDLNTPGTLSKYFRDRVLAEAEPQYVAP